MASSLRFKFRRALFHVLDDDPPHTPNSGVNHVDDFWSQHPQGAHFLYVDGSVHMLMNPRVWWALGSRAGNEVADFGE